MSRSPPAPAVGKIGSGMGSRMGSVSRSSPALAAGEKQDQEWDQAEIWTGDPMEASPELPKDMDGVGSGEQSGEESGLGSGVFLVEIKPGEPREAPPELPKGYGWSRTQSGIRKETRSGIRSGIRSRIRS